MGGWHSLLARFALYVPRLRIIPLAVFTVEQQAATRGRREAQPGVALQVLFTRIALLAKDQQLSALWRIIAATV